MALRMRNARAADAAAIASLHLSSWRDAYRGILPDGFLDGPLEAILQHRWDEALAGRLRAGAVVLATAGGDLAGFVAAWREGSNCHVDNLHVLPGARGAGIGRALLGHAAARLQAQGCRTADLFCFALNTGALRFYRELGAAIGPEQEGDVFGQTVLERRCAWADIGHLVGAAARPRRR